MLHLVILVIILILDFPLQFFWSLFIAISAFITRESAPVALCKEILRYDKETPALIGISSFPYFHLNCK